MQRLEPLSILADEATDVSNNVQMSLSIGWVDRSFTIHEDVLGLIQLPDTKAVTIFHSIKDVVIRCSLPLSQSRGQAFDSAANISGVKNGVQFNLKQVKRYMFTSQFKSLLERCYKHV